MEKYLYSFFRIKRYVEQLLMFPFIIIGKFYAFISPLKEEYDIFFFFPFYCIGGAERVNAEIIRAFPDKKLIVFFTKKSQNNGMKHFFVLPNVEVKEIQTWTDNKFIYWANFIFRGICSQYINSQRRKPAVFIGQCNFGYKLTPHLRRDIKISDLLHTYHSTFLWIWAPFIQFIDERVLISPRIKSAFTESFIKYGIPLKYIDNIKIVSYCLEYIPEIKFPKSFDLPLKVYYAGRGGNQKRVWIIISIINKCRLLNLPLEFKLAGSFQNEVPDSFVSDGTFVGEINGGESMYQFHKANDILLMTSAWEGFPIVIMEAMAFGSIPLVPDVDAIPDHIQEGLNGFLINSKNSEDAIIEEAIIKLKRLIADHKKLPLISSNAFDYVCSKFTKELFVKSYRQIILNE